MLYACVHVRACAYTNTVAQKVATYMSASSYPLQRTDVTPTFRNSATFFTSYMRAFAGHFGTLDPIGDSDTEVGAEASS